MKTNFFSRISSQCLQSVAFFFRTPFLSFIPPFVKTRVPPLKKCKQSFQILCLSRFSGARPENFRISKSTSRFKFSLARRGIEAWFLGIGLSLIINNILDCGQIADLKNEGKVANINNSFRLLIYFYNKTQSASSASSSATGTSTDSGKNCMPNNIEVINNYSVDSSSGSGNSSSSSNSSDSSNSSSGSSSSSDEKSPTKATAQNSN